MSCKGLYLVLDRLQHGWKWNTEQLRDAFMYAEWCAWCRSTSGRVASESVNARVWTRKNICQTVTDRRAHAASYLRGFLSRVTEFAHIISAYVTKMFNYLHVSVNACVRQKTHECYAWWQACSRHHSWTYARNMKRFWRHKIGAKQHEEDQLMNHELDVAYGLECVKMNRANERKTENKETSCSNMTKYYKNWVNYE